MRLEVIDESSGVSFLEIRLSPGDMMLALTGRSIECEMDVRGLNLVGSKSEHKKENVKFESWSQRLSAERKGLDSHERSPSVDKAFAPFEVNGWRGSASDLFNGHLSNRDGTQAVTFHRYVDAKTGKPILNP